MSIAVVGAGIAGLTSAIALARCGFAVDIFERAPVLQEIGAGIQLSPNAMAALRRLDVLDDLAGHLAEPDAIEIRDATNGRRLATIPLGGAARRRYGAPYCLIRRADLQAGLLAAAQRQAAISFHLGCEVEDVEAAKSSVIFSTGGAQRRADVLIAADGVHSRLRTAFFGYPGAQPLGHIAWRATVPTSALPASINPRATGLWCGPHAHLVHYPVAAGASLNVVVIAADDREAPHPLMEPFGEHARQLLDIVRTWTSHPLYVSDIARPWVRGRVALVGDAAHAMAPSAAQGGAQAIEDAWELAATLGKIGDAPGALRAYERARRPRVERIAQGARRSLNLYEMNGALALARNVVLRVLPASFLLSRLDRVFSWQPR